MFLDKNYEELVTILCSDKKFISNLASEIIKELSDDFEFNPLNKNTLNVILDMNKDFINFDDYIIICKVKEMLSKLRITQTWLAKHTQIPQSSLNGILNNTMPCSLEYAYRICKVMNITLEDGFDFVPKNVK